MDQMKTGRFIAQKRKEQNMTQMQLAEKLGITDRAVSKWERGKSLPDASIMLELCGLLNITVNDLLSGEVVSMDNYNEELEKNLLAMIKQKEQADKNLLTLEIFIGFASVITMLVLLFVAVFLEMPVWLKVVLIVFGFVLFLTGCFFALRIEQTAGYYECKECGYRYVPTYAAVVMAPHMGRKRYMKCPACGKKTYQKKVLNKD